LLNDLFLDRVYSYIGIFTYISFSLD